MADHGVLILIAPYSYAFWAVFAWTYLMEGRQHHRSRQRTADHDGVDKYSGLVISIGSTVMQLLAFAVAYFYEPLRVGEPAIYTLFWIGLGMIVAGILLRMHCWRVLGEFFTPTVTIAEGHRVVDKGAYRFVRHPAYSGAIMTLVGLGLTMGNLGSIAILVVGTAAIYAYRISAEEVALERALGDAYTKFKSTRSRVIPFVY
ncbi:MAG: isoprenylcysteine carboxylmethyltransferase family protein [Rubrivivax sp.]|nr:MAG: isoprenylcysteine carboxylmethyltransferase family protein [Rubrivivax sp.]